ncbi:hypothetical protein EKK58_08000 [Candidatus Dependentiae bacterium]|nr:MAG: hypothetical protein EKK58_08000 [Candidatus Dependentiae bacterium]
MNRLQFLLTKLAEEASEIAQIALKTQQFGLDELCPGLSETNAERTHKELDDLAAIVELLNEEYKFGYIRSGWNIAEKKAKIEKYYAYSKQLGMVE